MNTTSVDRPARRDSRGLLLKTAIVAPDVISSSLIGLVIIAALPPAVGFGVTTALVAVGAVLAAGLGENTAVRILYGARRPTPTQAARLAVPLQIATSSADVTGVQLRIVTQGPPVSTAGRRFILLSHNFVDDYRAGRITVGEVAALIAHGIGRLRLGHTRFDLLWVFWTAQWDFIRGLFVGAGRRLAWVPLGRFAWQTRILVGVIAVVLETQAGRPAFATIIAAFITLTYLMPYWRRSWEQHLNEAVHRYAAHNGLTKDQEPGSSNARGQRPASSTELN